MYERILIPLDGSTAAQITLPYAVEIAAKLGSDITLIRISEPHTDLSVCQSYLESITKQVQNELNNYGVKDRKVFSSALPGKPANEILRYAGDSNTSLLVMASRGLSGEGPWLLGSIAAKVLRAARRPVILIRALANAKALEQKKLVKRILIPLDGSRMGEAAVPYIEVMAQGLDAELVLFKVIEPITMTLAYHEPAPYPIPVADESRKATAMSYLDSVGKPLGKRGLSTLSAVDLGSPADQIIEYSEANAIDLIAMSTHGRSGIGRWVFGSVTNKVLHAGDKPVLVVPAPKR